MRKTKVICTIGPASKNRKTLENFIVNGMDIARINTSHSKKNEVAQLVKSIRELSKKNLKNTAILLDLQGPKIRIGNLSENIRLKKNQNIIFTLNSGLSDKDTFKNFGHLKLEDTILVSVDYDKFLDDINEGNVIYIDDGLIKCRILQVDRSLKYAASVVEEGGLLKPHKGINIPGALLSIDSVTQRDIEYLNLGIDLEVDFIAQSFVRKSSDILKIKSVIDERRSTVAIIAKIETNEAVLNFDEILKAADAIMMARGDLGVEIKQERIPAIQKEIIKKCSIQGKPVIVATQMLDSMIRNPRPTRAEVSDVANSIFDGVDAVMLSGETAAGKYPLQSLDMIVRIIDEAENASDFHEIIQKKFKGKKNNITAAIGFAACEIADVLNAAAIITSTQSGHTARQIAKNRPKSFIIGASPYEWVIKHLMLVWGVIPVKTRFTSDIDSMISEAVDITRNLGFIKKGDTAVITGGILVNKPGSTNFINVQEI